MKTAILAKAALCLCPPLLATAAAVTVPSVRTAAHRLTAPHRQHIPHKKHRATPCPAVKRPTFASALPENISLAAILSPGDSIAPVGAETATMEMGDSRSFNARSPNIGGTLAFPPGPGAILGMVPGPPINPAAPVAPPAAVPEPASWMMMIAGFLGVGLVSRRRIRPERGAGKLRGAGQVAAIELLTSSALGSAQTFAFGAKASSAVGAVAATMAKKAAVCVCSGAILATAVTTVPPLKRAVFAATMPSRALSSHNCGGNV